MELGEILSDALMYPLNNIKALVIYLILGIVLGIVILGTAVSVTNGFMNQNALEVIAFLIIGVVVSLFLGFVISGYEMDIIKLGIERSSDAPDIDFIRQFFNGVKIFVVQIVYMIIPIIIGAILAIIFQHWLSGIINFIISIVFSLALVMAQCRLAKTEELGDGLAIGEAIGDISKAGFVKVLLLIILISVISFILLFIASLLAYWDFIVGGIVIGILSIYLVFFSSRALGLLYSDV